MSEAELRAEIAELRAQLAPTHEPFKAECQVTACVLAYNNWRELDEVLLAFWKQDVPLHLRTVMDRGSTDPTEAVLTYAGMEQFLSTHSSKTVRSYKYLGDVPHKALEQVCAHAKAKFVDACETEYIYFCDGDVITPDGAIKKLLAELKADEKIGALCIPYELEHDHQLQGAMLMRTDVAKRVSFRGDRRCVCWDLAIRLKEAGLKMTAWASGETATHLKWRKHDA